MLSDNLERVFEDADVLKPLEPMWYQGNVDEKSSEKLQKLNEIIHLIFCKLSWIVF